MEIVFTTAYKQDTPKILAQADLLYSWQESIVSNQVKFIKEAKIEFIDYDIKEYPNQDKVKKALVSSGYEDIQLEEAYKSLLDQTRVMELIITTENY